MQNFDNHDKMKSIAICICTRNRPIMLDKCLQEITKIKSTTKYRIEILVIENDKVTRCKSILNKHIQNAKTNIHYFLEDDIGLSPARNRSINEALKLGTEWIAFIDDDAYPDEGWLDAYIKCMDNYPADVYDGFCILIYPRNAPDYLQIQPYRGNCGEYLRFASTRNVLLNRKLVAENGYNLRFRDVLKYSGGEDYELFRRAMMHGITIRRCTGAIVYETVTSNRAKLAWNLVRRYHFAQSSVLVSQLHNGILYTIIRKSTLGILKILSGMFGMPLFPLWPISFRIRKHVFKSMCRIAYGFGLFAGLLNIFGQPYTNTDGM